MSPSTMLRTFVLVVLAALGPTAPVLAQEALTPEMRQIREDTEFFTFFYRTPRPEKLPAYVRRMQDLPLGWNAYPPLVGLLAVVFQKDGEMIEKITPEHPTPRMADAIATAIRLSGREKAPQSVRDRIAKAGSDPTLRAELANLPSRLEDLRVVTASHLDILWGAFFASGSSQYVQMILDFFAATADRGEAFALDITQVTYAMLGGPKTILGELRGKYGDGPAYSMIVASAAEWALWSNARQHPAVNAAVTAYMAEHPTSFATRSLKVGMRNR